MQKYIKNIFYIINEARSLHIDLENDDIRVFQLIKAREELYKPKLLIDVTEEQRKEKQHEKEKEAEKEKRREHEKENWEREQKQVENYDDEVEHTKTDSTKKNNTNDDDENEECSRYDDIHQNDFNAEKSDKASYNRSLTSSPAPLPEGTSRSPSPDNYGTPPLPVPPPQPAQSLIGDRLGERNIS